MRLVNFSPLKLIEYPQAEHFDAVVGKWMTIREAENCYLLGQVPVLLHKARQNGGKIKDRFFAVQEGEIILGAAILFEGGSLCVTWLSHEMIDVLVVGLINAGCALAPVHGPAYVSWQVAQRWGNLTNRHCKVGRAERLYQLARLAYVPPEIGTLEKATVQDLPLAREWMAAFVNETNFEDKCLTPEAIAAALVQEQRLFFWKCPEVCAMAAAVSPTAHGISINFVYVPPEARGNGYGKAVTAALGKKLLEMGRRYCFILSDVADARANQVYQSIGARTLGELLRWEMIPMAKRKTG